jgi:hypothetical protein
MGHRHVLKYLKLEITFNISQNNIVFIKYNVWVLKNIATFVLLTCVIFFNLYILTSSLIMSSY